MHYLSQSEVVRLIQCVPDSRTKLAFILAYWHGMRISEVLALRGRDVDGVIKVKRGKGSLVTVQPIIEHSHPTLNEKRLLEYVLREYQIKPETVLFPHPRVWYNRAMIKAGKLAGIPRYLAHPHVLKHSIAMHLLEAGLELPKLQRWLGHKNLSSTGQYLRVNDAQAGQAVLQKLPGSENLTLSGETDTLKTKNQDVAANLLANLTEEHKK